MKIIFIQEGFAQPAATKLVLFCDGHCNRIRGVLGSINANGRSNRIGVLSDLHIRFGLSYKEPTQAKVVNSIPPIKTELKSSGQI